MYFNTILSSLSLIVITSILSANAAETIVSYAAASCAGKAASPVACDGQCHPFTGHSVKITGGKRHCVTYYSDSVCHSVGGTDTFGPAACRGVNTGGAVAGFRCAPTSLTCLN